MLPYIQACLHIKQTARQVQEFYVKGLEGLEEDEGIKTKYSGSLSSL